MTHDERLLAAFAEMHNPPLDSTNPHYRNKFASLLAVTNVVRPVLARHGLGLRQTVVQDGSGTWTVTYAYSATDETEMSRVPITVVTDPQKMGSALTYAKRYCLLAAFGLVGDEDDDAEAARKPVRTADRPKAAAPKPMLTEEEKAELNEITSIIGDKMAVWNAFKANGIEGARGLLAANPTQVELFDADQEF